METKLCKRCGELDIRLKDYDSFILSTKLTRTEQLELIQRTSTSLSIVFFVYLGIILGLEQLFQTRLDLLEGESFYYFFQLDRVPYREIVTVLSLAIGGWITYLRIKRYENMMRLGHALDHLNYISETNQYQYRIEAEDFGAMSVVVESINHLVESTEHSLAEERRAEETKDELIANVSHDIRTPLTSVIGYLDAVIHQQYRSEEEKDSYIGIAYNKAIMMNNLVNDLFLYIESGQATYANEKQTIPIKLFLEQLAAEFELEGNEQGVDIVVEVEPEDLSVDIDVDKMARVFSNFISNALKYGLGDLIRLRAYMSEDGSNIILDTCNNGQVLAASEYESIFERSYRSEKSRTTEIPGSGLGLSIVKNIVSLHGGIVYATVENNETVFRIQLNNTKAGESE